MEGRDIGTHVFPDADIKIFLDASPEARSERRLSDLKASQPVTPAEVSKDMEERDRRDRMRQVSPLVPAEDAVRMDTTPLSAEEVVREILSLVEKKRAAAP